MLDHNIDGCENSSSSQNRACSTPTTYQKVKNILGHAQEYSGWILCDFDGNFMDASLDNFKEFNVSKEDIVGLGISDFVDKKELEGALEFLQKVKKDGMASGIQTIMLMNGDERSYEYKDVAVYEGNEPVAVRIMVRDITGKVKNEQEQEVSEARYQGVFENTGLPTIILEENLLISMVNVKFEELSGYSKNEIEEKMSLTHFIDEETREQILKHFQAETELSETEYECLITCRDSQTHYMILRFGNISSTRQMIASFTDITLRKKTEKELEKTKLHLQKENTLLKSSMKERFRFGDIIGKSQVMQEIYESIINTSETNANIVIYGESGTGKELVAREIHRLSDRKDNQFVTVNCGAIPKNIIESEFFGYKKGAFTGAYADKPGLLDIADNGTLFLDEVGEIELGMQVKLLRVLDNGEYTPLGSNITKKTNIRIIAATNRNLRELIKKGLIREDFFYRIHIIPIHLPPLRERKEDILLLVDHFMKMFGNSEKNINQIQMSTFFDYDWPGNVRELQNVVHRFISMDKLDFSGSANESNHQVCHEQSLKTDGADLNTLLSEYEKKIITNTLVRYQWHRGKTAKKLGINRKTLFTKITKYGLKTPELS